VDITEHGLDLEIPEENSITFPYEDEYDVVEEPIPKAGMISTETYFMSYHLSDFSIKCQTSLFPAHRIVLFGNQVNCH